ncbi:peptide methionine sulfoxide reductase [Arenibacter aquaticus]|uniref:peptide-methionine (S)-S-oxide reductase n=2 Tax=Arenibacter aquaticus TaxID=2489054 RepID=A0A3S0BVE2_9FLAO|nr:peptide methionine sulfoxide reductase [Arenibacter aquaticus]
MESTNKIAFGGGCHWCTEAVFQSIKGVVRVEQGFVASTDKASYFSEAVVVHYQNHKVTLEDLILIHLHSHRATSAHSMRRKYRSAIYVYNQRDKEISTKALENYQGEFNNKLVTQVLPFVAFKPSEAQFQNYYYSNPKKPFCEAYISPKLQLLVHKFEALVDKEKL